MQHWASMSQIWTEHNRTKVMTAKCTERSIAVVNEITDASVRWHAHGLVSMCLVPVTSLNWALDLDVAPCPERLRIHILKTDQPPDVRTHDQVNFNSRLGVLS